MLGRSKQDNGGYYVENLALEDLQTLLDVFLRKFVIVFETVFIFTDF